MTTPAEGAGLGEDTREEQLWAKGIKFHSAPPGTTTCSIR